MNIIGKQQEKGQGLLVVLLLGGVLALVAWALTQSFTQDMKMTSKTQAEDRNFSIGDEALQNAMGMITRVDPTTGKNLWDTADVQTGYGSVTATSFTSLGGKMWINIRKGDLVDSANKGAKDDTAIATWTNQGDLIYDRTIFVRTLDDSTGKEARFVGVIHRNPIVTPIPGYAITGYDKIKIEAESGGALNMNTVNSCGPVSAQGAMAAPTISLELNATQTIFPTIITTPASTPTAIRTPTPGGSPAVQAVPGAGSIAGDLGSACTLTLGPADSSIGFAIYQVHDMKFSGTSACVLTVDASNGPVFLYVTGEFKMDNPNASINIISAPSCCISSYFTLYIGGTNEAEIGAGSFTGVIIGGPGTEIEMEGEKGAITFTGKLTGGKVKIEAEASGGTPGTANINYDMCVDRRRVEDYHKPPVVVTRWKQLEY